MAEDDLRGRLWQAVQDHPTQLTPDGQQRLRQLVGEAAEPLAAQPERTDEAIKNLRHVLDRAAARESEQERGETTTAYRPTVIDTNKINAALRDLCPIFPIC